ncbi:MAG: hypothetical protein WCS03_13345 [Bacteroidota bacterium]
MKTKTKLLFAIGLMAALCIGFLIGISVDYPKLDVSELAGTFGKAEKFHKVQMTAKDIQLRSELLKDTAQLRNMIQGLVYFSIFTGDVCKDIDLTVIAFKAKGMGSLAGESEAVKALQDYSDFIRNNNKALNSTIALLTGFYMSDTSSLSQDVEKNLKDFGTYVNGLNQKNMVLSQSLKSIDNFILTGKTLQANTTELTQLKSIRDQLLIKGLQLGGLIGNNEQVSSMIECAVGANAVNAVYGNQSFQATVDALAIKGFFAAKDLAGMGVLYTGSSNLFSFGAIGNIVYATGSIGNTIGDKQPLCLLGEETLGVIMSNYPLESVYASQVLVGNVSFNAISGMFKAGGQNAFSSTSGIGSCLNLIGSTDMGSILH